MCTRSITHSIARAAHGAGSSECSRASAVVDVLVEKSCGPGGKGGRNTAAGESKVEVWKDSVCVVVSIPEDDSSVGSTKGEVWWLVGERCGSAIGESDSTK